MHRLFFKLPICLLSILLFASVGYSQDSPPSTKKKKPTLEPGGGSVYFGHVLAVDPDFRSIFVRPVDGKGPRRTFFMDRKTYVTLVDGGFRYRRRLRDLVGGEKVAIRYLWMSKTFFAEEVFLIPGKFYRGAYLKQNYRGQPRKRSKKKKEDETAEEGKETKKSPAPDENEKP